MAVETTAQSEVGELRELLLKHPRSAFGSQRRLDEQWRQLGYLSVPDFARAISEYDAFVAAIEAMVPEVEVTFLPADDGATTIDSIYVRDAAVVSDRGLILAMMGKEARQGEPSELGRARPNLLFGRIESGHLEGGDLVWLDESTVAIGHGYRTDATGIEQFSELVGCSVVEVGLPHYRGPSDVFHLMSILSPIDRDLALVYSPLMPVPFRRLLLDRGISLVEVPDEEFETLGANVLAVAPRKCLLVDGNPKTAARLESAGAEVRTFAGSEICIKGGGGPTCLTRPLRRRHCQSQAR